MEQITNWRKNKNKISEHNIEIGSLNDQIGLLNEQIGSLREVIGEHKEKISICENYNRETPYYWVNQWVNNNLPSYSKSFDDSVSQGQYDSKLWLIKKLRNIKLYTDEVHIDIVGSWFGFPLIEMLSKLFKIKQIDLYDLDDNCHKVVAQYINHFDLDFKIVQHGDYFERTDLRRRHIVINTSSEHMSDIVLMRKYYKDYPDTPILVIQSNNYFSLDDHINCVNNVDELIDKNHINRVLYKGTQKLPLYDRYMVIGQW